MPVKNKQEMFLTLLSNVRQGAERSRDIYHKLSDAAEIPEVKEALNARAFVSEKDLETIDECFKILNAQPVKLSGRFEDAWVEDFRSNLSEIQSPEARHLFIMSKAHQLNHFRMGEYVVLMEIADLTHHYGVGVLLASCLTDKAAFMERTRHLIRVIFEGRMEERKMAA